MKFNSTKEETSSFEALASTYVNLSYKLQLEIFDLFIPETLNNLEFVTELSTIKDPPVTTESKTCLLFFNNAEFVAIVFKIVVFFNPSTRLFP